MSISCLTGGIHLQYLDTTESLGSNALKHIQARHVCRVNCCQVVKPQSTSANAFVP